MPTTITSLTHLGLGRTETGDLIPRVLPGEEIEIVAGEVPRIIVPSSDRVRPPCRHYKNCGGCAMQHASDDFVAAWKQDVVRRALLAQGLSAEFSAIATSPSQSRRRAKLAGRRLKKGALVGFHAKASDVIVSVPNCQLLSSGLMASFPALEELTSLAATRKTEAQFTVIESRGGLDVLVDTPIDLSPQLRVLLAALAQKHALARLTWNDETVVTLQEPGQLFGKALVVPPPGAFLQATVAGERALLNTVIHAVQGADKIVDLFSGSGTFTLPLAERASVHAVEGEPRMIAALDKGWRGATGLKRVTSEVRDLFRRPLEPDELSLYDAAVIDPPRAGAEAQIATLARSDVERIAMVSCNPVTFARDAATLVANGYKIGVVQVVDQFRWSAHIEIAAGFTRA